VALGSTARTGTLTLAPRPGSTSASLLSPLKMDMWTSWSLSLRLSCQCSLPALVLVRAVVVLLLLLPLPLDSLIAMFVTLWLAFAVGGNSRGGV
jgi:hypothetical protein